MAKGILYFMPCVFNYKPLYDKTDVGYKSLLQRENCWQSVATSLLTDDRCVKKFNSIQEKEIRKVVSDWLSQAKHRKYKKEQRASRKLEQPIISTGGAEDINDMDI
ncbi:hypothetical protein RN001_001464 [Aquatica leii]|uniref:MADF domain-containing protein n=1 Tax=Aquatica leii TaxID=1421715 RepID=A0AAN7SQX4_9COLE|nr:hypothetical protein RN001_001464 [Aquatica leii]